MELLRRSVCIALLLAISFAGTVLGNSVESTSNHKHETNYIIFEYDDSKVVYVPLGENTISPMAVDACPGRGSHEMLSNGWGTLIRVNSDGSKTTIFKNGAAWQCKWCYEVLVTQYDPLRHGTVGYYCMRNPGYKIGMAGVVMEASPSAIKYTSGSQVPYCRLFYR